MTPPRRIASALVLGAMACASHHSTTFRGVDAVSGQAVTLRPHPMPENRAFTGTFRSPHLGLLTLRSAGGKAEGSFERTVDGCLIKGELANIAVHDNVAEFDWIEHQHCPTSERKVEGRGFFLYDLPNKNGRAQLFGRRYLTARPFHEANDDTYGWFNVEHRDDPWTAIEVLPR